MGEITNITSSWRHFPMGPNLRSYLKIEESSYEGDKGSKNPDKDAEFVEFLTTYLDLNPVKGLEDAIALMEELNIMGMAQVSLKISNQFIALEEAEKSFSASLVIGTSYLLEAELNKAENWFICANELDPTDIIPIVNMAQTFYAQSRDDEAVQWIEAGWKIHQNHQKLWELYTSILLSRDKDSAYEKVCEKAFSLGSYLGVTLATDLGSPDNLDLKLTRFHKLYDSGVEDPYFLVEYTASLGENQQYEKIPSVIWQAKKSLGTKVPWQLISHGFQASIAVENWTEAKKLLEELKRIDNVPDGHIKDLEELLKNQ